MKKVTALLLMSFFCFACSTAPALAGEVNLSIAASLREVVDGLTDSFSGKHPGVKFLKNYGGSGVLAKQIENGAPADIFISANLEWMDYLKVRKLVDARGSDVFAFNTLVFVGATDKKVLTMHDLLKLDRIAIGSPQSVPAGEYAMVAFRKAGIDRQLEKKLVMARDVREALMYAERGEVDGSFVYRTDLLRMKRARLLFTVPAQLCPRVSYPAALTVAGTANGEAAAFFRFLHSGEAHAVLEKYGFEVR